MSGSTVVKKGLMPSIIVISGVIASMLHARSEQRENVIMAHQEVHLRNNTMRH